MIENKSGKPHSCSQDLVASVELFSDLRRAIPPLRFRCTSCTLQYYTADWSWGRRKCVLVGILFITLYISEIRAGVSLGAFAYKTPHRHGSSSLHQELRICGKDLFKFLHSIADRWVRLLPTSQKTSTHSTFRVNLSNALTISFNNAPSFEHWGTFWSWTGLILASFLFFWFFLSILSNALFIASGCLVIHELHSKHTDITVHWCSPAAAFCAAEEFCPSSVPLYGVTIDVRAATPSKGLV